MRKYGSPTGLSERAKKRGHGWVDDKGYVRLGKKRIGASTYRSVLQHRSVMESILGRPLRASENVHHINGKRDDNRPENLELWVKSQPSGQRPQDLVKWAREILALYGAEVDRDEKTDLREQGAWSKSRG
jgi:hypothetical protein